MEVMHSNGEPPQLAIPVQSTGHIKLFTMNIMRNDIILRKAFGSRSSEVDRHGSTIQLRSADQCRSQGPRSPQQKFVLTRINYVTDYINNTTKQRELGFRTRTAFPMGKRDRKSALKGKREDLGVGGIMKKKRQ